jgi:holo-[acyl-carrier protein] synthase
MPIGTDIVSVARLGGAIERFGDRFLNRSFHPDEVAYCRSKARAYEHFAGKFAAKEAVGKLLRVTWDDHIAWREIVIANDEQGVPFVALSGNAARLAAKRGIRADEIEVSVAHCADYATATAIASRRP